SDSRDAGEAQSETRRVARAGLDFVVLNLDDELGAHFYLPGVLRGLDAQQPLHQIQALLIGQPLESLADHLPLGSVAHAQPVIAQRSRSAAMSPFGSEDNRVERLRGLDLEPKLASFAGLV